MLNEAKFDAPKTKEFLNVEAALGVADSKNLYVVEAADKNFFLSSRNVKSSNVVVAEDINTYSVLNAQKLIITEGAVSKLNELLG